MESTICSLPAGMWLSLLGWELGSVCWVKWSAMDRVRGRLGLAHGKNKWREFYFNHLWLVTQRNKFSVYKVSHPSAVYPGCTTFGVGRYLHVVQGKGGISSSGRNLQCLHTSVMLNLSRSGCLYNYMLKRWKNLIFSWNVFCLWNCIVIPESGKKKTMFHGFSGWTIPGFFSKYAHGHNVFGVWSANKKMSQVRDVCRSRFNEWLFWPTWLTCHEWLMFWNAMLVQLYFATLLHKFQGPERVETMWQCPTTGRQAVPQDRATLGRPASVSRASFVFVFRQPLKMCAAYCEQWKEVLVLTNGWLTFFCVAKRLVAQTRDFCFLCEAALYPLPQNCALNIRVKNPKKGCLLSGHLFCVSFFLHFSHSSRTLWA